MGIVATTLYTYIPQGEQYSDLAEARRRYTVATLDALYLNLESHKHDLWLHIADDGSAPEWREYLWELAGTRYGANRSITNSERRGYGGNYNSASHVTHNLSGIVGLLHLEDDWQLSRTLNVDPLVTVLEEDARIGMIRLAYIGYTHPLRAEFIEFRDQHFLLLDPHSPSQYVFAGGPRIETVAWARSVGPWPERLPAGETELLVCGRVAARQGVAWPIDLIPPRGGLFNHIGTHQVKNVSLGMNSVQRVGA
jgi:hypothetical protein